MMFRLIFLLLVTNVCEGQEWQAELMAGASGYNGDLTQRRVTISQLRPGLNLNIKYNSGNVINVRAGIVYTRLVADDKNSTENSLKRRNLNFKSDILELNAIVEINLFDPEVYVSYPYLFGGAGVFHFNPFTYDKNNLKTYLQPLGTEGQGLEQYPERKKYSLIQLCIPVGAGWKWIINDNLDISYELGYRILFTDYLDDVSKTYVNLDALAAGNGPKSAELSYRGSSPFRLGAIRRGNSGTNDSYFFTGIKISTNINSLFR
ncbi:MAG: DUF6089 family protein [Ginsengibacter sp.]